MQFISKGPFFLVARAPLVSFGGAIAPINCIGKVGVVLTISAFEINYVCFWFSQNLCTAVVLCKYDNLVY